MLGMLSKLTSVGGKMSDYSEMFEKNMKEFNKAMDEFKASSLVFIEYIRDGNNQYLANQYGYALDNFTTRIHDAVIPAYDKEMDIQDAMKPAKIAGDINTSLMAMLETTKRSFINAEKCSEASNFSKQDTEKALLAVIRLPMEYMKNMIENAASRKAAFCR